LYFNIPKNVEIQDLTPKGEGREGEKRL
jgi:hypothetical protein